MLTRGKQIKGNRTVKYEEQLFVENKEMKR